MGRHIGLDLKAYNDFKEFLRSSCGIELGDNKEYLVATRVRRIISENSLSSITELTSLVKTRGNEKLKQKVIDAMTTNETYWFRDSYPFDYLGSHILPAQLENNRSKPLKVWSAACSAGQEPYSISMVIEEFFERNRSRSTTPIDIVATDLSCDSMHKAKLGEYDRLSVSRGLSQTRMDRYLIKKDEDTWVVKPEIRRRVQFRPLNLQDSYALMGKYDVIYCRNVLIYFAADLKAEILKKLYSCLEPNGVLFLGASEAITGAEGLFDMVNCNPGICYIKR